MKFDVAGSIYLDDCPRERYIPIYLIVAGVFGLVKALLNSGQQARSRHNKDENDGEEQSKKPNPIDSVLSCFLFAWFIAGMWSIPTNTTHLYNIYTTSTQRLRRWSNIV